MPITTITQEFDFGGQPILLRMPVESTVQATFLEDQQRGAQPVFPYWAKLWPAAIGLCQYLETKKDMLRGKTVLEMAAGLGLPSLVTARHASRVICSDYMTEAVEMAKESARLNHLNNIDCRVINWCQFPAELVPDVVIMSDINYDPSQFEILQQLLLSLLQQGVVLVLSTPQRMMGKPFIESLLPFCREKLTSHVETRHGTEEIFIMQLQLND